MKKKILLVEDDIDLNQTIVKYLTMKGLEVKSLFDGKEAIDVVYEEPFELIILDVKLPSCNGFEVAKKIREFSNIPIIFLTSLDSEKDIEEGFLSGADDYMTKPFSLNELYLRIDAVYRRLYKNQTRISIDESLVFDVNNLTLYKNNKEIHLKNKEAKLLALFLQRNNEILTKNEIFDHLYTYNEVPNETSLRTFICRLRSILPKGKIETLKEIGYQYVG